MKISGGPDGTAHNRPISTAGEKRQFLNPEVCYGTKSSRLEKNLAHSSTRKIKKPAADCANDADKSDQEEFTRWTTNPIS